MAADLTVVPAPAADSDTQRTAETIASAAWTGLLVLAIVGAVSMTQVPGTFTDRLKTAYSAVTATVSVKILTGYAHDDALRLIEIDPSGRGWFGREGYSFLLANGTPSEVATVIDTMSTHAPQALENAVRDAYVDPDALAAARDNPVVKLALAALALDDADASATARTDAVTTLVAAHRIPDATLNDLDGLTGTAVDAARLLIAARDHGTPSRTEAWLATADMPADTWRTAADAARELTPYDYALLAVAAYGDRTGAVFTDFSDIVSDLPANEVRRLAAATGPLLRDNASGRTNRNVAEPIGQVALTDGDRTQRLEVARWAATVGPTTDPAVWDRIWTLSDDRTEAITARVIHDHLAHGEFSLRFLNRVARDGTVPLTDGGTLSTHLVDKWLTVTGQKEP